MVQELALRASIIVWRLRQLARRYLISDVADDFQDLSPQSLVEVDPLPAPRAPIPNETMIDFHIEHFLKAECLGAQLKICRVPMSYPRFVLDRMNTTVVIYFDSVGAARQPERFGPEWNSPEHPSPSFHTVPPAVHAPMTALSPDGMSVVAPNPITVD